MLNGGYQFEETNNYLFYLDFFLIQSFIIESYATTLQFRETIASANGRIYAINKDGDLYYWGKATFNDSIGDQSIERSKPAKLMDNVIGVYGDWWSGFAVKSDNTLWAIGDSGDGRGGEKDDTNPPVKIMDNIALPYTICHNPSTWAKDSVNKAIELEFVPEMLQSYYQKGITRREFVQIISNLLCKIY